MKKLFFFFALMFAFMAISEAQITTGYIIYPNTYWEYQTNVTLSNAVAQYFVVDAAMPEGNIQDVIVQLDSLSGNHTNVAVALYGRKSDQTSTWTAIGSAINWKGTTADTTIIYSNTTENNYRQFKILFTGTGTGTTRIDNFEFKVWLDQLD